MSVDILLLLICVIEHNSYHYILPEINCWCAVAEVMFCFAKLFFSPISAVNKLTHHITIYLAKYGATLLGWIQTKIVFSWIAMQLNNGFHLALIGTFVPKTTAKSKNSRNMRAWYWVVGLLCCCCFVGLNFCILLYIFFIHRRFLCLAKLVKRIK